MKKIILFLLLLINVGYSQIDTANYNFNLDLLTGKYTSLISKNPVYGAQGFKYVVQELQATSIDTTLFQYIGNIDGKYTIIQNIATYYGKDSGTVQMMLVENPLATNETFGDSTTFLGAIWQLGTVNDRPIVYQKYSDQSTQLQSFVGQVGVSEANWGLNLDYRLGVHNYWDSTRPIDYLTINQSGITWQHIPKGYPNVTELPDAWAMSGNTAPLFIDTSGFMGIIGGLTSIFRTKTSAIIGTSSANDYTDTTKYNFYGKGGKNYFQNKVGIGTTTPYSKLHLIGDAGSNHGSYNANADLIVDDAGTRALVQLINPTSSYIAFGDATTYNLGYLGYTNSTGILNIQAPTAVDIINIRENGVALTSKYSQLGASNTFTGKMVVGTGTSNGTADFLVMGDTTTLRGTVYRDSSFFRVMVNPFSQRMKVEVLGKTGNNMFTIDSTLITSALAMTLIGDIKTGGNLQAGSNNKSISWLTKTVMYADNDGELKIMNNAETSFVKFTVGAGNFTAGFIRGTVDSDITSVFVRTPNGTLRYILVADDGTISTSTTAP